MVGFIHLLRSVSIIMHSRAIARTKFGRFYARITEQTSPNLQSRARLIKNTFINTDAVGLPDGLINLQIKRFAILPLLYRKASIRVGSYINNL